MPETYAFAAVVDTAHRVMMVVLGNLLVRHDGVCLCGMW